MSLRKSFFCGFLLLAISGISLALENSVGGNAKIASMGFSQVVNSQSFLANPANLATSKLAITLANTELYGIGLNYNYLEATLGIGNNWRVSIGFESMVDKDLIDNSGYSQQFGAIGIAKKLTKNMQLGLNLIKAQYDFFNEDMGSGYSVDTGLIYGPLRIAKTNCNVGVKVENVVAQRKYTTDRKEVLSPTAIFGFKASLKDLIYVMDLKEKDFRCGVEYNLLPSLALRAGLNNGELTLGLGVSRAPIRIDYAYWLSEIGATHRIGSMISF